MKSVFFFFREVELLMLTLHFLVELADILQMKLWRGKQKWYKSVWNMVKVSNCSSRETLIIYSSSLTKFANLFDNKLCRENEAIFSIKEMFRKIEFHSLGKTWTLYICNIPVLLASFMRPSISSSLTSIPKFLNINCNSVGVTMPSWSRSSRSNAVRKSEINK